VLVVPAIGDGPYKPYGDGEGWLDTLNAAIYPESAARRDADDAPACPDLKGKDTVRTRPEENPGIRGDTVRAGLHWMGTVPAPPVGQGFSPAGRSLQRCASQD
jgi:hypothetical protein